MVNNADFIGCMDTNLYKFQHYNNSDFSLFVNGKQFLNEGLSLGMGHKKNSVMAYRLFSKVSAFITRKQDIR